MFKNVKVPVLHEYGGLTPFGSKRTNHCTESECLGSKDCVKEQSELQTGPSKGSEEYKEDIDARSYRESK